MNDSVDRQEQLLEWFDGGMANPFPQQYGSHEEAAHAAGELALAREVLRAEGRRGMVSKVHKSYFNKESTQKARIVRMRSRTIVTWLSAAAALLIIFFLVRNSADKDSAETLYADAFTYYQVVNVRATGDSLSEIVAAYNAKNYGLAVTLGEQRAQLLPEENLLVGLSFLENKNLPAAAARFESLRLDSGSGELIRDASDYYLALTMILQKRFSEAAQLMKRIGADKQHTYQDRFSESYIQRITRLGK